MQPAPRAGKAANRASTPALRLRRGTSQALLLFGGSSIEARNDLWEHGIRGWRLIDTGGVSGPPAYNVRGLYVPFLGKFLAVTPSGETWVRGSQWERLDQAGKPHADDTVRFLYGSSLAYDPFRRRVILFGGDYYSPAEGRSLYSNATWEFDGTSWQRITTAVSPPGTSNGALSFDPERRVVVLASGTTANVWRTADVWEYDGMTWSPAADLPYGANEVSLVWDASIDKMASLIGGILYYRESSGWVAAPSAGELRRRRCRCLCSWQPAITSFYEFGLSFRRCHS